jgi:hypothetical protein
LSYRYLYFAKETRAEQDADTTPYKTGIMQMLWPDKQLHKVEPVSRNQSVAPVDGEQASRVISDEEWMTAQRALRQASGAACFYLITTDILGPFGLAYSFATVGWA